MAVMWCDTNSQYTKDTQGTEERFWDATEVWVVKPHVANRRLCGAKIQATLDIVSCKPIDDILADLQVFAEICKDLNNIEEKIENACVQVNGENEINRHNGNHYHIVLRDLVPKQPAKYKTIRELIIQDRSSQRCVYVPLLYVDDEEPQCCNGKEVMYQVLFQDSSTPHRVVLQLARGSKDLDTTHGCREEWLREHLLHKLARWSEEASLDTSVKSLRLVPVDRYNQLYNQLKLKYGQPMVKVWPEKTDPQKFVFEDVAIAAYLLLLWEEERIERHLEAKQSFVDLGCGNGLLVYILAAEGHAGLGLDVRRRGIWDLYEPNPNLQLREESILPSDQNLFPQHDWLIGNHSDELHTLDTSHGSQRVETETNSLSSSQCSYFVLPCCHFDFDRKFSKKVSGTSQYRTYLDYVQQIGEVCGFKVEEDVLRIPSTKRVCHIGRHRTYEAEASTQVNDQISDFISHRCQKSHFKTAATSNHSNHDVEAKGSTETHLPDGKSLGGAEGSWAANFQPRPAQEVSRSPSLLEPELKEKIISEVFSAVLNAVDATNVSLEDGRSWNAGGSVELCDIASMLDKDTLCKLKNKCGGLQTLLRNHHSIFMVRGGCVKLRNWMQDAEEEAAKNFMKAKSRQKNKRPSDSKKLLKTKLCWFHRHHPDGCPRPLQQCTYAHGAGELTAR